MIARPTSGPVRAATCSPVAAGTIVRPSASALTLAALRLQGNAAYARCATAIGGTGAINFEVQALVYLEGARNSQERVFMVQFPAGRQSGLFPRNVSPFDLATGDSQVGTPGGEIGGNPDTGRWCLLTFAADGTVATTGLWDSSMESLDGVQPYTHGGRTKGVESSLTGNRVDLNGGGVDFGWANGIRYAEFRAYNGAPRSQAQRHADLTNTTNFSGAIFWFRFSDNGSGGVTATDMTGNGNTLTIVNGTLAVGPTL